MLMEVDGGVHSEGRVSWVKDRKHPVGCRRR